MAQLFHRSANSVFRLTLLGLVLLVMLAGLAWSQWLQSDYIMGTNYPIIQPIPFSHQHHVLDDGLDCRYCHATVEISSFAGMPSTHVCMTCHSQIWTDSPMLAPVRESLLTRRPIPWVRVHDLPDFTYFDHSVHVNKGIGCSTCHGRVDMMPLIWKTETLTMRWCLDCHTQPELFVRPREEIFNMEYVQPADQLELGTRLVREYGIRSLTQCSTCHR